VAAQRGDLSVIRELIESGRARATDRDEQNITPLHWAAINAQVPACRYLLEQGAEVDALGGDLVATPMQWAARNGYLYVIQLLIAHGADPNIKDTQGYNTLHLVTHSSSIMPLLYLLHQPISVDERDSAGHTALMWAAYQGDALSVELLLKHGANSNTRDDSGLTPLHWAVVRGNKVCILKLFEKGAEIHAKDNEGRTARDMAVELKSLGAWKRALEEGGFSEDGAKRKKPLSEVSDYMLGVVLLMLISTEEYQAGRVLHAHDLSLLDLYYTYYSPVVYRHDSCHGGVLRHASRRYWPSITCGECSSLLTDRLSCFIE
jgi:palmitoyltransferase ZDHHC13/17